MPPWYSHNPYRMSPPSKSNAKITYSDYYFSGIREYAYRNMREQRTMWGRLVGVQVSPAESAAQQDTPAVSWNALCN
jgi:hypothetical protein